MEQLIDLLKSGTINDVKKIINQCYKSHDLKEIKSSVAKITNDELNNLISTCQEYVEKTKNEK